MEKPPIPDNAPVRLLVTIGEFVNGTKGIIKPGGTTENITGYQYVVVIGDKKIIATSFDIMEIIKKSPEL